MAQIQFRRGTKAQIDAYTPSIVAQPLFSTDTGDVFIDTGSAVNFVGKVDGGTVLPSATTSITGKMFYRTDENNKLYVCDGATWIPVGVVDLGDLTGDLDDISDGATYGKVLNTELNSGAVIRLNDGVNIVTASETRTHLDSTSNPHQVTLAQVLTQNNDAGGLAIANVADPTNAQDVATKNYVDVLIGSIGGGIEFQNSVLDRLITPPVSPTLGDRYLIDATLGSATGAWAGQDDNIAEWDGASWVYTTPETGWFVSVDDEPDGLYYYGGSGWAKKAFENTTAGTGLNKAGTDIFIDPLDSTLTTTATQVGVNYDDVTIGESANTGGGLEVKDNSIGPDQLGGGVAGNGLQGGGGSPLAVQADATTGGNVANALSVSANGVGVNVDSVSIIENGSNQLEIDVVDGGVLP